MWAPDSGRKGGSPTGRCPDGGAGVSDLGRGLSDESPRFFREFFPRFPPTHWTAGRIAVHSGPEIEESRGSVFRRKSIGGSLRASPLPAPVQGCHRCARKMAFLGLSDSLLSAAPAVARRASCPCASGEVRSKSRSRSRSRSLTNRPCPSRVCPVSTGGRRIAGFPQSSHAMSITKFSLCAAVVLATTAAASAELVAGWSITTAFPTGTGMVPTGVTYGVGAADQGVQTAGSSLISVHALAAATYTSPSGNGSQYAFSSNNWSTGDYYQAIVDTTGYTGVTPLVGSGPLRDRPGVVRTRLLARRRRQLHRRARLVRRPPVWWRRRAGHLEYGDLQRALHLDLRLRRRDRQPVAGDRALPVARDRGLDRLEPHRQRPVQLDGSDPGRGGAPRSRGRGCPSSSPLNGLRPVPWRRVESEHIHDLRASLVLALRLFIGRAWDRLRWIAKGTALA